MNSEEQSLIDGLFSRLKQAEADGSPRDVQAEQRIREHVANQPAAAYYMAQAILVQEAAVKRLDEMNRQLKAELEQARAAKAPAQSGGFLSGLFGGPREPAPVPSSGGGWREPGRSYAPPPAPPQYQPAGQPGYQPGYAQPQQAPGGGFMRGALQTAAGVAGGVMLAEGLSSLFHHNNAPQEIVEIIREEPSPASDMTSDHGGWGSDNPQPVSDSDWNNDRGGFSDADFNGGDSGGFFSDDDDYV
ncbi:DUF2076 domain-containing protein [Pseudomonas sp. RIT-PI-S]|uniref:DUF2076 domain-containing protein n=1 Tax=Pseudomonas sp. RIT-PI-S TaxID=3035295 RepID=UPI0021D96473|nr:DUF2076 domain-containing protein [Pseudomonas sp. RIT-PI-S]